MDAIRAQTYDETVVLSVLKARLDRGGMAVPVDTLDYYKTRIAAAAARLAEQGVRLTGTTDDNVLLADYTAWTIQNRDKPGREPEWLRYILRNHFLSTREEG